MVLRGAVVGSMLVIVGAVALGQQEVRPKEEMLAAMRPNPLVTRWNQTIHRLATLLRPVDAKKARKAEKIATRMEEQLIDNVIGGEGGCELMGYALIYRAIAEGRQGKEDAALWHWQMAQSVLPDLRRYSFSNYPDVEALLEEGRIPEERWEHLAEVVAEGSEEPDDVPGLEQPKALVKLPPAYPEGARRNLIEGPTVVEVMLDTTGVPRAPVVMRGCGAMVLDVAAMEVLREWRYTPARLYGAPVETPLSVTFTYRLE